MTCKTLLFFFILSCCLLISSAALSSDLAREKRIADNIKDSNIIGEIINLKAANIEFIGLLNNQKTNTLRGSVLILHGMESNPNAPQIMRPLRHQLAQLGWVTTAIQLPMAEHNSSLNDNVALIKEISPRVDSALGYLRENFKNSPCVVIAHSLGATMAVDYFARQKKLVCDALVVIGLPTLTSELPETQSTELLKEISIPILDIYGKQDLDNVKRTAPARRSAFIHNNPLNRQLEVSGADHVFTGLDDTLVLSIHNWLMHVFKPPIQPH